MTTTERECSDGMLDFDHEVKKRHVRIRLETPTSETVPVTTCLKNRVNSYEYQNKVMNDFLPTVVRKIEQSGLNQSQSKSGYREQRFGCDNYVFMNVMST